MAIRVVLNAWTNAEKESKMGKSLFKSKTFWLNVLGVGVHVAGIVPPQYGVPALAILNVLIRLLTEQPITGVINS